MLQRQGTRETIVHPVQRHNLAIERYEAPSDVDEAVFLLNQIGERARLIFGGTDLLLELQRGDRPGVDTLIDISRIADLDQIRLDAGFVRLGAGVTHNQIIRSELVVNLGFPLAQACWEIGSPQLRNRATVVGNIVTASPANDTISALHALDAELKLASTSGERTVRIADFHTGVRKSILAPDEMVTEISFPINPASQRGVFVKLGLRRAQAISVVHLTCLVDVADNRVGSARIVLGSVGPVVMEAEEAGASLVGKEMSDSAIREAAQLAMEACRPIDDIRGTATYRVAMTGVMVGRALELLRDGRERERWPLDPVTLAGRKSGETRRAGSARHSSDSRMRVTVNGEPVETWKAVSKTLLDWLRDDAGPALGILLTGTKEGCGEGECGACTVFLDGDAVMACLVPAPRTDGTNVVTIEGLAGGNGKLHPLQQAFVDLGAVQCGFCTPGLIMAAAKLLEEKSAPNVDEIRTGLSGNLCRCTGYYKIIAAVESAAQVGASQR